MSQVVCAFCNNAVQLCEVKRRGLGSKLMFRCMNTRCTKQTPFPTCPMIPVGQNPEVYSVNRKSMFAMRCTGGDLSELKTFCGIMDLPKPVKCTSYKCINETMEEVAAKVQKQSMQNAGRQEYNMSNQGQSDKCMTLTCRLTAPT